MFALYNEIEPSAVQWLKNLVNAGHVREGIVDARSIKDLRPSEIAHFAQAHFFAGIGVWSHALRLAGWPDDRPVWTGSCPCQPFSVAGKGLGFADPRHLWPDWFRLIRECRPPTIFGEQVAGKDGAAWLDLVQADLEGAGYAFGAAVLPAAGVGAPHIRHRIYWVAYAAQVERGQGRPGEAGIRARPTWVEPDGLRAASPVAHAHAHDAGLLEQRSAGLSADRHAPRGHDAEGRGEARGVGESAGERWARGGGESEHAFARQAAAPGPVNGFWADAEWIPCRDGRFRPAKPGIFPLAHGTPGRVGRLRAYGNAIVAQVAATFIEAVMDATLLM